MSLPEAVWTRFMTRDNVCDADFCPVTITASSDFAIRVETCGQNIHKYLHTRTYTDKTILLAKGVLPPAFLHSLFICAVPSFLH